MSGAAPSPSGPEDHRSEGNRPGERRARKVDAALLLGCSIAIAISLLFGTGVAPSGLYPSSPARWSLEVPTCTYPGEGLPSVQHAFPLWATVHVQWTATGGDVWYIVEGRGVTLMSQIGASGSGSFVSDSYAWAFGAWDAFSPNAVNCTPILVNTTVTYTL